MRLTLLVVLLAPIVTSLKIRCQYQSVATFASVIGSHYKCYTRKVSIKNPNEVIEAIEGAHEDGKSYDDVKSISFFETTCHYFPKGLEKVFKNLQDITVYHSDLRVISRDDLQPFPELRALSLENNRISSLDSNLFEFNTKLKRIKLRGNFLTTIGAGVFDSLKDLEELSISYEDGRVTRNGFNRDGVERIKHEIALKF